MKVHDSGQALAGGLGYLSFEDKQDSILHLEGIRYQHATFKGNGKAFFPFVLNTFPKHRHRAVTNFLPATQLTVGNWDCLLLCCENTPVELTLPPGAQVQHKGISRADLLSLLC